VLDTLALAGGEGWLSIDWDLWDNAGEAESASMPTAIYPVEGQEAFLRLLGAPVGSRVLVVISDLAARLKAWVHRTEPGSRTGGKVERHPRPNLPTSFTEAQTETERDLAEIWGAHLGVAQIGIHDRFFDLGGHSLLAAQIAAEVCDHFQVEMPVLKLFQAPTVAELAVLVDKAKLNGSVGAPSAPGPVVPSTTAPLAVPVIHGETPAAAAKETYRDFYNDVTRRLERSGVGDASFFLNYGYISLGEEDDSQFEVAPGLFNPSSVRLAFELIGKTELQDRRVLDVGCGRGGTAALMAQRWGAKVSGVDLAPEAVAFCRRVHGEAVRFEVGDAENLPFDSGSFDVVTNIESSHTYPNLRAFFAEVRRVLADGGRFLYTDLLPVQRWMEVRVLLGALGFTFTGDRSITANVLASCDNVAATRAQAFGGGDAMIDNFLAVPGSVVYEQMKSGAWDYRIVRTELMQRATPSNQPGARVRTSRSQPEKTPRSSTARNSQRSSLPMRKAVAHSTKKVVAKAKAPASVST
jgi:SAM-dependent methyltransferase/acyl carrier protein